MNFNKFAKSINETLVLKEDTEGRNPNTSFADWKAANPELASGPSAYYHFKKSMRGDTTPAVAPVVQQKHAYDDPRKQEVVDQLVSQGLSPEEIYKHLNNTLPGETPFYGDLKTVKDMVALAKNEEPVEAEPAFNPEAEKAAKMARLRSFFMKPKAERDRILAAKRKAAEIAPSVDTDDEEGSEDEEDPYVSHYVKAMKKNPYDADDVDPVEAD